jgi:hypothetical protein
MSGFRTTAPQNRPLEADLNTKVVFALAAEI